MSKTIKIILAFSTVIMFCTFLIVTFSNITAQTIEPPEECEGYALYRKNQPPVCPHPNGNTPCVYNCDD